MSVAMSMEEESNPEEFSEHNRRAEKVDEKG
jgi:hypothetical protein